MANNSPMNVPLIHQPTNPEPTPQPSHLSNSLIPNQYSLCPQSPKARYWATEDNSYGPEPAQTIQTTQFLASSGTYPASPIPYCENPNKGSGLCSFTPLPPDLPWCFLMWPCEVCLLFLEIYLILALGWWLKNQASQEFVFFLVRRVRNEKSDWEGASLPQAFCYLEGALRSGFIFAYWQFS